MGEKAAIYNYSTVAELYKTKLSITEVIESMREDTSNSYKLKNLSLLEYYNQKLGDLLVQFRTTELEDHNEN